MKNRLLAILLLLALLLAAAPATSLAASKNSGKIRGNSASISITGDGVVLNIKWDKVSGATGYEYAYNLFWNRDSKKSDYTVKSTDKTSATIRLKDYGAIDIYARAYKKVRGRKVYGEWTNGRLKRSQVDRMIVNRLKKNMKSKDLFLRAERNSVSVRAGAGDQYATVAELDRGDEARATGNFKRDDKGTWWSEVKTGVSQGTSVTGWVSRKNTNPVWY